MDKVYPLPLSRSYVRNWGVPEAIRELIQNGIDSPADFEYALLDDGLVLRSRGVVLDPATLVLGVTSKADDADKIGSFGEGYKIALLVLAREGRDVQVINGAVTWAPEFRFSDAFGAEMLHIVERRRDVAAGDAWPDLEFRIFGLSSEELQAIQDSCLLMQPPMDDAIETQYGRILESQPGRLYVGGLFICETELQFGYDVKPAHITLERDRKTVDGWDLKRLTSAMWMASSDADRVAELIENESPDASYLQYGGVTDLVAEACYRRFSEHNPGAVPVHSQAEYDKVSRFAGRQRPVFVGGAYHSVITRSPSYQRHLLPAITPPTPLELLQTFAQTHRTRMQRRPRKAMLDLIAQAATWKVG